MSPPVVLILASGRGDRFIASGGTTHKLHTLLGSKTILQHTLDAVRSCGLPWHIEDAGHPGMGDSIAAAVGASRKSTPQASGWLILPGDLPFIKSSTLLAVAQALSVTDVVLPRYRGKQGHPVGFSKCCELELLKLTGDLGASSVVRAHRRLELSIDDVGSVTDIDTMDDLRAARRHIEQSQIRSS